MSQLPLHVMPDENPDKPLLLLVDDKPENLDVLVSHLGDLGYELAVALSGEDALDIVTKQIPSLILLDVMMPGIDGFNTCLALKKQSETQDIPVIFMSALVDIDSKVLGFSVGGVDFITKPFQREEVLARINAHLTIVRQRQLLQSQNSSLNALNQKLEAQINKTEQVEKALSIVDSKLSSLSQKEAKQWGIHTFVGNSPSIINLLEEVRSLQFVDKTNVLVLGESGTGKELISRAIHFGSKRSDKPFVAVNCAAIPVELADAEFFGHTKGAFTGAVSNRNGHFVDANGGTLFLDEIGDMPLGLQAKLLRVLEDGMVTQVGGGKSTKVNVRIVAATNMNLQQKVQDKSFRQDLYFRLAGYVIKLPPLRNRIDDIPLLSQHFLALLAKEMGREPSVISDEAMTKLKHYSFPGNIRELKNLVEHALISSRGAVIAANHFHFIHEDDFNETAFQPVISSTSGVIHGPETNGIDDIGSNKVDELETANHEQRILAYVDQEQKMNNSAVQDLLGVSHGRASYLLKKLLAEGKLKKQGERRWAHYVKTT